MSVVQLHNCDALVHVDEADLDAVTGIRWLRSSQGYACAFGAVSDGRPYFVMHRLLLGLRKGDKRQVDHVNRDRLDNRRANLRVVAQRLNLQNNVGHRDASSRFRGVTWDKRRQKWAAQASDLGRHIFLGRFDDEIEAAVVAERWRLQNMPGALPDPLLEAVTT